MSGVWHWVAFGPLGLALAAYIIFVQRELRRDIPGKEKTR